MLFPGVHYMPAGINLVFINILLSCCHFWGEIGHTKRTIEGAQNGALLQGEGSRGQVVDHEMGYWWYLF